MGTTIRDLVFKIGGGIKGGRQFKAVQMGGPSGGCIPAELADTPVDFESIPATGAIMGSGGMVVLDDTHLHGGDRAVLPGLHPERILRQVHLLPHRHAPDAGDPGADHPGRGHARGRRQADRRWATRSARAACAASARPRPTRCSPRSATSATSTTPTSRTSAVPAGSCSALVDFVIDPEKCTGCTLCAKKCPVKAITGERKKPHVIDTAVCVKCGQCIASCKFEAIYKK